MDRRTVAAIVALVVLALAGTLLLREGGDGEGTVRDTAPDRSDRQEEWRPAGIPADWRTHSSADLPFSLMVPPRSIVDRVIPAVEGEPARLRVRVIGPESGAATEITDGFTFYARVVRTGDTTSLRELAGRILDERSGDGVPDTLAQDEVDDREAYRFSTRSELGGRVQHLVLAAGEGAAFVVSYVISGPPGRDYRRQVGRIVRSLKLATPVSRRREAPGAIGVSASGVGVPLPPDGDAHGPAT